MSQNWIYINSAAYRSFIHATVERKGLLAATGTVLAGISMFAGYVVLYATNPDFEEEGYKDKQQELDKLPLQAQIVARTNREQLKAMIMDITTGNDSARYNSLLNGKIHNTRHGTSMPDPQQ